MNSSYSTVHTPIDYLSYLGSDIAVSLIVLEIRATPVGTLSVTTLSIYVKVTKAKLDSIEPPRKLLEIQ